MTANPQPSQLSPSNTGLVCRHCGCRHFLTVYTRPRGDSIVRRKRCRHCGEAITTREKVA
jgi:transcriptional regulator NrdR family protein